MIAQESAPPPGRSNRQPGEHTAPAHRVSRTRGRALITSGPARSRTRSDSRVIRKQEAIGFPVVTDGEFRRRNFQEASARPFRASTSRTTSSARTSTSTRDHDRSVRARRTEFAAAGPAITHALPVRRAAQAGPQRAARRVPLRRTARNVARSRRRSGQRRPHLAALRATNSRARSMPTWTSSWPTSSRSSAR